MSPHFEGTGDEPTAIDLFAGCGGLSYGLFLAGFNVRAAWEIGGPERLTYYTHHSQYTNTSLYGDATDIDPSKVPDDLTMVGGGPSCQPWSSASGEIDPDDPRYEHAFATVEWVDATNPKLVLIENVAGMAERHGPLHSALVDDLEAAGDGYTVRTVALNAADYGVPQRRERVFILGVRSDIEPPEQWTPEPTHRDGQRRLIEYDGVSLEGYSTARDAFENGGDGPLPRPLESQSPADDPVHVTVDDMCTYRDDPMDAYRVDPHSTSEFIERDGEQVWMPPNHVAIDHDRSVRESKAEWPLGYCGTSTTDRRLHPDEPAPTMTISQSSPPVHYTGRSPETPDEPVEHVRRLTVREVARLQTFPDAYTVAGNKDEQYRQVGNAVPPLLAAHVACHLKETVLEDSRLEDSRLEASTSPEAVATDGGAPDR